MISNKLSGIKSNYLRWGKSQDHYNFKVILIHPFSSIGPFLNKLFRNLTGK